MRLATFEAKGKTSFGVVKEGGIVDLGSRLHAAYGCILDVLQESAWVSCGREAAIATIDFYEHEVKFLPPVLAPEKIVGIGVNYRGRTEEYRDDGVAARYPSVFFRTAQSFAGHEQAILRPTVSDQLDYEGEIALVIGTPGRHISAKRAQEHIAAVTVANDGTVRDWARHSKFNVTQGKNFELSGSIGPWLVPACDIDWNDGLRLRTWVNGELRQDDHSSNLVFDFAQIIEYLSVFMTLFAGDIILTGTPVGAGIHQNPPRWLKNGDVLEIDVSDVGTLRNNIVDEK